MKINEVAMKLQSKHMISQVKVNGVTIRIDEIAIKPMKQQPNQCTNDRNQ